MRKIYPQVLHVPRSNRQQWRKTGQALLAVCAALLMLPNHQAQAQNALIGSGFGANDWATSDCFNGSAGSSRIRTFTANGTGNQFFRLVTCWDGNFDQWGPSSNINDLEINIGSPLTSSEVIQFSTSKAYFINVSSTSHNYVFKTRGGGNPPGDPDLVVFNVEGDVRTVSSVTRSPSGTVYPGQDVTVEATLSGAFATGQAAFLRYTTDDFSTSTVVKMTGSGTTYTADIPASANGAGTNVDYYVFTSGDVASVSASDADFFTINLNNNGGSNYEYTVANSWTTAAAGDWSDVNTWDAGVVPPADQPVTLENNLTVDASRTHNAAININSGQTLTISAGQTLTLEAGIFGAGGVTVDGTLQINNGGFTNIAPTYNTNATLVYNSGTSYGRGTEWSTTSGAGYPHHVQLSNNTTLQLANGNNGAKALAGNLTVDNGSTLDMQSMTGALTVNGDLTNNGTVFLSLAGGGDLAVGGNWTEGASSSRSDNNRAVTFSGNANQTITRTGGGTVSFTYLLINKAGGNLVLSSSPATNVNVTANAGDVLQLLNGGLDLNGQNLTLTASGGNLLANGGARTITGSAGSTLTIDGAKTVTNNGNGTLTIDDNVTLVTTNGGVNFGLALTTLEGTLEIQSGGFVQTNFPTYSAGSTVLYNTGGNYNPGTEWDNGTIQNVAIAAGSSVTLGSARTVNGNLTINGTLVVNTDLSLEGNLTNSGTLTHNSGTVTCNGSSAQSLSGNTTFLNLSIDNGSGVSIAGSSQITITRLLQLDAGNLITSSGNTLLLQATATSNAQVYNNGGAVTGSFVTAQRFISGGFDGVAYRQLSVPFSDANYADLSGSGFSLDLSQGATFNANPQDPSLTAANFPNLFIYDTDRVGAGGSLGDGWQCPTAGAAFPAGSSATVNVDRSENQGNSPLQVTGTLNNGSVSIAVTNPSTADNTIGWNLLGNPYPSPLDIDAFLTNNTNLDQTIYVFTSDGQYSGTYASRPANGPGTGSLTAEDHIGVGQGFFVQSDVASGNVTFTNSMRPAGYRSNFVSHRTEDGLDARYQGLLRLFLSAEAQPDRKAEAILTLHPEATEGKDRGYEAYLIQYNPEGWPTMLFHQQEDAQQTELVIKSLAPAAEAGQVISDTLKFMASESGTHHLSAGEINHFPEGTQIILEDRALGVRHFFAINPTYTFETEEGFHDDRFVIHLHNTFQTPAGLEELAEQGIRVSAVNNAVQVVFERATAAQIQVLDIAGRKLASAEAHEAKVELTVGHQAAVIVRILTSEGIHTAKLLMNN